MVENGRESGRRAAHPSYTRNLKTLNDFATHFWGGGGVAEPRALNSLGLTVRKMPTSNAMDLTRDRTSVITEGYQTLPPNRMGE